jgi:hypothetical protein
MNERFSPARLMGNRHFGSAFRGLRLVALGACGLGCFLMGTLLRTEYFSEESHAEL